jgi:hypothetical protein
MKKDPKNMNRRSFIGTAGTVTAGWVVLPGAFIDGLSHKASGNKLNINGIGAGKFPKEKWWEKGPLRIVELEEGYEFREKAALLNDLGANMEHLTTFIDTSPGTSFLYNHNLFTGKAVDFDSLREYLREAHKKNIKVVIYYNVHAIASSYAHRHPEWQQIQVDGKPIEHVYRIDSSFCINSPWREEVFGTLKKLATYGIDGVFYDGPIFFSNTCYCASCRRLFKEKYKKEINSKTKLSSVRTGADWKDLIEFQSDSIVRFLKDSGKILKEANPQLLFYMNGSTLGATWPTGRNNRKIIQETDILGAEGGFLYGGLTESIYKPGAVAKLLEAQAGGKPTVIFNAAKQGPWALSTLALGEISILYSQTISHQANVWLAVCDEPRFHEKEMGVIKKYNNFIRENPKPFFKTKSMARIALLWPQEASNYYRGSSVPLTDFTKAMSAEKGGNLEEEFYGFYDALSRNHFPFDVLDEESVKNDLDKYDLIILPNAPCFNKEEADKITDFVRNGGNIISTFETSLYNGDDGEKLGDFQLKDVLGIADTGDVFGPLNYDYVSLEDMGHFSLKTITQKLTYAPTYGLKLKASEKAKVPVFFCKPLRGSYAGKPKSSDFPFIIDNIYGKGRSIYFAGTFGGSLDKFHFPEYYQIVDNLVSELSKPIVELEHAPSSVEVNIRRGEASIFLYLINFTSSMVRPIQKIVPCTNLKINLFVEENVKNIKALWLAKNLEFSRKGNLTSFVLPVVDDYEVVEIRI